MATAAALVATFFLASGANADVVNAYLWWGTVTGTCSGENYQAYSDYSFDPAVHSAVYTIGGVVSSPALLTQKYNQDGVRTATRWFGCNRGAVKESYIPKVYNHRWFTDTWWCAGNGCAPAPRVYGSWVAGTGPRS